MLICITPNPAIDRTLIIPSLRARMVQRSLETLVTAGGKGLNAARVMRTLGGDPLCMGLPGGHSGHQLAGLVAQEGLRTAWTWCDGETRTCVILVEKSGTEPTVINEPGPQVTLQDWEHLQADVLENVHAGDFVCFSGSLPPGSPPDSFKRLIQTLTRAGAQVWVDTSGAALKTALDAAPAGIKINKMEASAGLGRPLPTMEATARAAKQIRARGIASVVLTFGKEGALLADANGLWLARPPAVQALSPVGSGDSLLGALVLALEQGLAADEALRWGVAAGAANTLTPGSGLFNKTDFEQILSETERTAL